MIFFGSLIYVGVILFTLYCSFRLVSKTGYTGWLVLLAFVPFVNFLILLFLVFSEWPLETKLRRYREQFGELPDEEPLPPFRCLNCSAECPVGTPVCPACGWSYPQDHASPVPGEPETPASPAEDFFRNQRGF